MPKSAKENASAKKTSKTSQKTTAKMSAKNLVPSKDKLSAAVEAVAKGKLVEESGYCLSLPKGKSSIYNAWPERFVESAAFVAILINCNFCSMTAKGRLEVTTSPANVSLMALMYGTRKPWTFHGLSKGRMNEKGLTTAGKNHFQGRMEKDSNHSWATKYELVKQFVRVFAGKSKGFTIKTDGKAIKIERGSKVMASRPAK